MVFEQILVEVDAFEKMRSIEREHVRVNLGGLDTAVAEELAYKFQRPAME